MVGAGPRRRPARRAEKGTDHGSDGKIFFRDDSRAARPEPIIIQVKDGKTGVKDVRDLRGVLDREKAAAAQTRSEPVKPDQTGSNPILPNQSE